MKKSILSLGIMTCLCAGLSHAGFLDNALKVASAIQNKDTASALNHAANMATTQKEQQQTAQARNQYQAAMDVAPLSVSQLSGMDCAALAVTAAAADREKKSLVSQAETYDNLNAQAQQEAATSSNKKMLGGLMSFASKVMAETGRGSEYSNTLANVGNNLSNSQAEVQLQGMDAQQIVAMHKKHDTDLENIKIYQKAKSCKF